MNSALINPSYYESDKLIYVLYLIYWEDKSRRDNYYIYIKKKVNTLLKKTCIVLAVGSSGYFEKTRRCYDNAGIKFGFIDLDVYRILRILFRYLKRERICILGLRVRQKKMIKIRNSH